MSFLNTQGTNDIQNVANFTQAVSQLGLLDQENKKLQTFVTTADMAGALSPGRLDMATVNTTVGSLQSQGVLPMSLQQPEQVLQLVHATRNLGINSGNFPEKIQKIQNLAQQFNSFIGDSSEGKGINWHKLHFSPYDFKHIHEVDIQQCVNEHGYFRISGTLPETADSDKDYVQMTEHNTPIALHYMDQTGTMQCLFRGIVTNIRQRTMGGFKHLEIEAASFSYQLDTELHSRSFQREQEPYSYIFSRVNELARQYIPGLKANVVYARDTQANQTTGKLIIQYQETDWTFLKRVGSHHGLGLFVDPTYETPAIYLGLPPEQPANSQTAGTDTQEQQGPELNVSSYQIRRDTAKYTVSTENYRQNSGTTFSENDFTYCEAYSMDILNLGQKITFLGLTWYVRAIHTFMDKGTINNRYTLANQQGLMQDDLYNTEFSGVSLKGIVKEVVKDQVKVHITEIDETWDEGSTWYFNYTTVYSSPDGSGLYIMPEIDDNVRIYFPNNKEQESVAVSSVNLTPSQRGKREDPNTKILSNVHGKQVILTPGGIQIIANGGLLMTLSDDGGLTIKSNKKILLDAEEEIGITSKNRVFVTAQNEIELKQGSGRVNMNSGNIQASGNQVKIQP